MELDAWIEFEEEQNYEGKMSDWAKDVLPGEYATRRSPFFPNGHDAFDKVRSLANSGKYETDYRDALTRYVIVPKSEIVTLIKSLYCNIPHINERLGELLAFVEKLPDDKPYKLFCQEF
jgi:rhodanese-related sulfurtransferase